MDIFHAAQQTAQETLLKDPTVCIDVVENAARNLYGTYSSTMTVYNLPSALMVPITASVIPAVSGCRARHDRLGASRISGVRAASGHAALPAHGRRSLLSGHSHRQAPVPRFPRLHPPGRSLSTLGLAAIFVCVMLICNSILQAHGMVNLPILTVVVGGIVATDCQLDAGG